MSARTQQVQFSTTTFPSHPMFTAMSYVQGAPIVPNAQTHAHVFPALAANGNGPFTSYPAELEDDDDDEDDNELLFTYESFSEEPVAALPINTRQNGIWALCIEVPIVPTNRPTLVALDYMIKYASNFDDGNSTIQTDTILTTETLPIGILTKDEELANVYKNANSYSPRMIDHDAALRLSSTLSVKCNGTGENWNHYVDTQRIAPNVRVVEDSHLYVVFHVCEYPTTRTVRNLSIEVSATWQKEEVEKKAIQKAERIAREEAAKKAQEEAERKAREAEERQARNEERDARAEERQERQEARRAREEERRAREEEKQERAELREARRLTSIALAPAVPDDKLVNHITESIQRLGMDPCPTGRDWVRTSTGYRCTGGQHSITFEQLGMK